MSDHFNGLTPAEAERLAMLAEECGEVIQIIGKILRHGYASHNPHDPKRMPNKFLLSKEMNDIFAVWREMEFHDGVQVSVVYDADFAWQKKLRYAHHQDGAENPAPQPNVGGVNWESAADPAVRLFVGFDVEGYVKAYELCGDDGDYSPNEQERVLLIDAIYGVVSNLHEELRKIIPSPPAPQVNVKLSGSYVHTVRQLLRAAGVEVNGDILQDCMIRAAATEGSADAK